MNVVEFYEDRLRRYRENYKILGYGSKKSQIVRFKVLTEIGDLNGDSVLDVGCGLGDLIDYLGEEGIQVNYTGYDISPKILERARELHPAHKFELRDILEEMPDRRFDWVFCSGLNTRRKDNESFMKELIRRMFSLCNKGVAVNMLSQYADFQDPKVYYFSPEEMLRFCMGITRKCVLRHDYMPHDFTIYLFREK